MRAAIERALALSLVVPAGALLAGCMTCSDDREQTNTIAIPPVRCDGTPYTTLRSCPPRTAEEVWILPDGGAGGYYEAAHAWVETPCAVGCQTAGYAAVDSCAASSDHDGHPTIECRTRVSGSCDVTAPGKGRRPDGFTGSLGHRDDVGTFFVVMGELEDASVPAFRRLKSDLARLGAPKRLRRAASRAAREERRHTRAAFAFARRAGRRPLRAAVPRRDRARTVEDLARENAVEGCVHELHGALVAAWAVAHAPDASVRAMMARVAEEESRHAALGFELLRFYDTKLDADARARVREAAREAAQSLPATLAEFPKLVSAGLAPPREAHAKLLDALVEGPWRVFGRHGSR